MLKRSGILPAAAKVISANIHFPTFASVRKLVEKYKLGPLGISFRLARSAPPMRIEDLRKNWPQALNSSSAKNTIGASMPAMIMHSIVSGYPVAD